MRVCIGEQPHCRRVGLGQGVLALCTHEQRSQQRSGDLLIVSYGLETRMREKQTFGASMTMDGVEWWN